MEKDHDLANNLLLGPGIFDALPAHGADAIDIFEAAGFILDNIENPLAKFVDELFGVSWANAFDHAAAQIFLDAFASGRRRGLEQVGLELKAELTIADPFALGGQPFAGIDGRE